MHIHWCLLTCFMKNRFIFHKEKEKYSWKKHKKILTILILNAKIQSISLMLFIIMNGVQGCTPFTFANGGNGMRMGNRLRKRRYAALGAAMWMLWGSSALCAAGGTMVLLDCSWEELWSLESDGREGHHEECYGLCGYHEPFQCLWSIPRHGGAHLSLGYAHDFLRTAAWFTAELDFMQQSKTFLIFKEWLTNGKLYSSF